MIRRPPRSTLSSSSAASDVYKRQYQRRVREKEVQTMAMPCHRAVCALLVHLAVMSSVQGIDMTRPGWFSRDALNFAREEGTGFFFTTGHFRGTNVLAYKDVCNMQTCFKVPSVKMQSNGRSDIFLAKYGPRNQLIWAKKAGGMGADIAESVALSNVRYPDNNAHKDVYITGTIQGKAWFDTTKTVSALSANQKSIFIAKYNTSDGGVRWTKLAATCDTTDVHSDLGERFRWRDSYSHCNSRAIGIDDSGDVIITGKFFGTLNFDNGVRLVSGTQCRVRAGTGRVCEHSVFMAKFQ
eukprot:TRINITY_DN428_c0_g1_i2.p1 TRINITY_DN428_c0_g1~~TRINITY_DN428_c0_g1_i2.p1  ORF type:complete len:296 (-),score=57.75 TRINITY_DN428_c0_g1_i2:499-1386(-)